MSTAHLCCLIYALAAYYAWAWMLVQTEERMDSLRNLFECQPARWSYYENMRDVLKIRQAKKS